MATLEQLVELMRYMEQTVAKQQYLNKEHRYWITALTDIRHNIARGTPEKYDADAEEFL